jgi:hypothetical protein
VRAGAQEEDMKRENPYGEMMPDKAWAGLSYYDVVDFDGKNLSFRVKWTEADGINECNAHAFQDEEGEYWTGEKAVEILEIMGVEGPLNDLAIEKFLKREEQVVHTANMSDALSEIELDEDLDEDEIAEIVNVPINETLDYYWVSDYFHY